MTRRYEICIDANDPDALRPFWQEALGYRVDELSDGAIDLVDPDSRGPAIWFQTVPESKTIKNRVHLDIWFESEAAALAMADGLKRLGGKEIERFGQFLVFADPEGNELCLNWET